MRKTYDKAFKAKIALEAIQGEKTIQRIAQDFEIHPNMVALWRSILSSIFLKEDKSTPYIHIF